jgi:hypothetical protein
MHGHCVDGLGPYYPEDIPRDHQPLFVGEVWQVSRHELRYLSLLCHEYARHETYKCQNYFCERHE